MSDIKKEENGNTGKNSSDPDQFRKLFIGGLSINTTDESLREFYSQFGQLIDCVVMRDPQTKKSRCFGFVSFTSSEELDASMLARPHEIDGKVVDPKRAVPRDQSSKSESNISTKRLYISGVREEHTEEDFKQYFSQYGDVEKAEIIVDKVTNKPRGFAFVSFNDYDPVDKCVLVKSHMINGFRCDVKKALSKDEMNKAAQMDRERELRGMRSRGQQRNSPHGGRGGGYGGGGYYPQQPNYGYQPDQWGGVSQQQWAPPAYGNEYGGYGGSSQAGYSGVPGQGGWQPSAVGGYSAYGAQGTASGGQYGSNQYTAGGNQWQQRY